MFHIDATDAGGIAMKWDPGLRFLVGFAGLIGAPTMALAHHSFAAQYDSNQLVELQGKVTKVEWMNPHTFFYIYREQTGD